MHFQHLFVLVLAYFAVGVIGAPLYNGVDGNRLVGRTITGHRTPEDKQAHIVAHELSSEPKLGRRSVALARLDAVALSRRDTLSLGAALHRFIRRNIVAKAEMEAAVAHMPSEEMREMIPGMLPRIALPPVV